MKAGKNEAMRHEIIEFVIDKKRCYGFVVGVNQCLEVLIEDGSIINVGMKRAIHVKVSTLPNIKLMVAIKKWVAKTGLLGVSGATHLYYVDLLTRCNRAIKLILEKDKPESIETEKKYLFKFVNIAPYIGSEETQGFCVEEFKSNVKVMILGDRQGWVTQRVDKSYVRTLNNDAMVDQKLFNYVEKRIKNILMPEDAEIALKNIEPFKLDAKKPVNKHLFDNCRCKQEEINPKNLNVEILRVGDVVNVHITCDIEPDKKPPTAEQAAKEDLDKELDALVNMCITDLFKSIKPPMKKDHELSDMEQMQKYADLTLEIKGVKSVEVKCVEVKCDVLPYKKIFSDSREEKIQSLVGEMENFFRLEFHEQDSTQAKGRMHRAYKKVVNHAD